MPQDINGSCIVDVVCCGMRRGWRVKGGSSGSGQLTHEVAKRQGTIGLASAQRGSGLFWRINQFPRRSISAAGERAKTRPYQSRELPGNLLRPTQTTSCSDGDIKDSGTQRLRQGRELLHDCQANSRPNTDDMDEL